MMFMRFPLLPPDVLRKLYGSPIVSNGIEQQFEELFDTLELEEVRLQSELGEALGASPDPWEEAEKTSEEVGGG